MMTSRHYYQGKIEGGKRRGMTEDEMVGWHHQLNGHEWVNSGSWWWTGRPGALQSMGLQRVGHNWANELNWLKSVERSRAQGVWKARPRPGCPMTLLCDLGQTLFSGLSLGFLQGRLDIPRLKISILCKPRNHPNFIFPFFYITPVIYICCRIVRKFRGEKRRNRWSSI